MTGMEFVAPICNALFWSNGALVAGALLIKAVLIVRRVSPGDGCRLFRFALFAPLVMGLATFGASVARHQAPAAPIVRHGPAHTMTMLLAPQINRGDVTPLKQVRPAEPLKTQAAELFVLIWLSGVLIGFVRLSALLYRILALKRASQPASQEVVHWRLSGENPRAAEIRFSESIESPMTIGFVRPRVLLPTEVATSSTCSDNRHMVLHEFAHLRRYDDIWTIIERIAEVLFWINPAARLISGEIAFYRELSCDEAVIEADGARRLYAQTLLRVAQGVADSVAPAANAFVRKGTLARRLRAIAENRQSRPMPAAIPIALAVFAVLFSSQAVTRAPALARMFSPLTFYEAVSRLGTHAGSVPFAGPMRAAAYFMGSWTCYNMNEEPMRAIGVVSYSIGRSGTLHERVESVGGTWTYRSTMQWNERNGRIAARGSDNVGRMLGSHTVEAYEAVGNSSAMTFEAGADAAYSLVMHVDDLEHFDSLATVRTKNRLHVIERALCERTKV